MVFVIFTVMMFSLIGQAGASPQELKVGSISFWWEAQDGNLYVKLSAPTTGWVAVGIEPTRIMKDADMYIGYVNGSEVVLEDQFADKLTMHHSDVSLGGKSNIISFSGKEENGVTTIEFTRPLNTGDSFDKVLVPGNEYNLIFAYGTRDNLTSLHREKGKARVRL